MAGELIVSVPGPWEDDADLRRRIINVEPEGRYLYAGRLLTDLVEKDQVGLELFEADPELPAAFDVAGQRRLPQKLIDELARHRAVACLRFPPALPEEIGLVRRYSLVLQGAGGMAIKVESAGIAHTWERWSALTSGTAFDLYCAMVVLVGDTDQYFSCGMHHYGLPECAVPRSLPSSEAAEVMNHFNAWRIIEQPLLEDGHTFSLSEAGTRYRMTLEADTRHDADDLFHNSHGVWCLSADEAGPTLH